MKKLYTVLRIGPNLYESTDLDYDWRHPDEFLATLINDAARAELTLGYMSEDIECFACYVAYGHFTCNNDLETARNILAACNVIARLEIDAKEKAANFRLQFCKLKQLIRNTPYLPGKNYTGLKVYYNNLKDELNVESEVYEVYEQTYWSGVYQPDKPIPATLLGVDFRNYKDDAAFLNDVIAAAKKIIAAAATVDAASDVYKVFGGCQIPTTDPDNSQKP